MTPLLILVFGIKPLVAIGTDLAYGAVTKTLGGWRHFRNGTVDLGVALWLAFGSAPGAVGGVIVDRGDPATLRRRASTTSCSWRVAGGALPGRRGGPAARAVPARASSPSERHSVPMTDPHEGRRGVARRSSSASILGLTSVGSGALIGLALILVFRLTPQRVVGTDVFHAAMLLWVAGARAHGRRQRRLRADGEHPHRLAAGRLDRHAPRQPRARRRPAARAGHRPARVRASACCSKAGADYGPASSSASRCSSPRPLA